MNSSKRLRADGSFGWSRSHDRCKRCGRSDRPAKTVELCGTCYSKVQLRFVPKYPFGVHFESRRKHFVAKVRVNGKQKYLGSAPTAQEASLIVEEFCRRTNFTGKRTGVHII